MTMKLTILGSGSPKPNAERCSSGYLLEVGGEKLMIEAGPGTVQRLVEAGHSVTDIDKLVISHLHFDHWLDFMRLAVCRWDLGGPDKPPLKVWGPVGIRELVEKAFGPEGLLKPDLTARTTHPQSVALFHSRGGVGARPWPQFEVTEIDETTVLEGADWRMTFREVPHHQPYLISYGMRVESKGKVFAYSSDISWDPDLAPPPGLVALAQDADLLVQYTNMFGETIARGGQPGSGLGFHEMIARMAQDARAKAMITTHLGPQICKPGLPDRILSEMRQHYRGDLHWGRDLMTFDIGTGLAASTGEGAAAAEIAEGRQSAAR